MIRRSDAKGLQLSQPGDHAMVASVRNGKSGWIWTPQLARVYGLPLTNPAWIAINCAPRLCPWWT